LTVTSTTLVLLLVRNASVSVHEPGTRSVQRKGSVSQRWKVI